MTEMNLDADAEVYCKGGHCGVLHRVVVDEQNDRITDLIVEREAEEAPDRVVPVALVVKTDDQGVHLCIHEEKLDAYPAYQEIVLEA
ncbi:MAG: hypothetical protein ACP5JG_06105 [Anaerolineae bacterium]